MHDIFILAGIVLALVLLDLAAHRFGVDTRQPAEPPETWW